MAEPYSPRNLPLFRDSIRDALRGHEQAGQWLTFHASQIAPPSKKPSRALPLDASARTRSGGALCGFKRCAPRTRTTTVPEAAALLQLNETIVRRWLTTGRIRGAAH